MSRSPAVTDDRRLILLPNSNWASNIGNPFFTLAAEYLLERTFPDDLVFQTAQLSSVARNPSARRRRNELSYVEYGRSDLLVLCGPMMHERFVDLYDPILDRMDTDETKIVMLSAGAIDYTDEEVRRCREFLKDHPPDLFVTRDSWTHETFGDLADRSIDGIDLAFFTPDFYPGYPTPSLEPYVTFTFDTVAEPDVALPDGSDLSTIRTGKTNHGAIRRRVDRFLKRDYPERLGDYTVVRPTHGTLNRSNRSLYSKPNAFFSQTPFGYLNLYRNTSLTLGDRVHSCVPTIAYGGTAQLFSESPRARLFDRVGLGDIVDEPVSADMDELRSEKEQFESDLQGTLREL